MSRDSFRGLYSEGVSGSRSGQARPPSVDAAIPGVPQTAINHVTGGRLATDHLIGLGHRRIGFFGDSPSAKPPPDWASPPQQTGCEATGRPDPRLRWHLWLITVEGGQVSAGYRWVPREGAREEGGCQSSGDER
jgi:hypothetical protein